MNPLVIKKYKWINKIYELLSNFQIYRLHTPQYLVRNSGKELEI